MDIWKRTGSASVEGSSRNGFLYVGAAIDGTHIAYKLRKGEYEQDYKNYKTWTSLLCIGIVNAFHLFLDIDVGWPCRLHDKTCTDHSNIWNEMHMNRKRWLGEDGVALADTAWGGGSELVMTPYTFADGSTEAQQWYNLFTARHDFLSKKPMACGKTGFGVL